jgi:anti-sigma regulatory factor (Ser/Thr protein kinase)
MPSSGRRAITTGGNRSGTLLEMWVERDASQIGEVRHGLADVLASIGQEDLVPDASLVVSELIANAIVDADSLVQVTARRIGHALRLSVRDDGAGSPELSLVGPDVPGGRGLLIVDRVATRWGVEESDEVGKTVWCELDMELPASTASLRPRGRTRLRRAPQPPGRHVDVVGEW